MDKQTEKQTDKQTAKKEFNIYKLLTFLLAAILVVVLAIMLYNWYVTSSAEKQFENLATQVNRLQNQANSGREDSAGEDSQMPETQSGTDEPTEEPQPQWEQLAPQKNLEWDEICKVNADIYAWICIPGTEIDYPILQHPTDDSYYLNYNMSGTRGYPGCIYTERLNRKDFTDFNTVVYGHNMRNNSMFSTLHYFEDRDFFDACPYVYIYTGDRVLVYEIFAAYTSGNEHILYANDFSQMEGRQSYLEGIFKSDKDVYVRDVELSADSHIITLSTCIKGRAQNRYLVQAVLLNEEALTE